MYRNFSYCDQFTQDLLVPTPLLQNSFPSISPRQCSFLFSSFILFVDSLSLFFSHNRRSAVFFKVIPIRRIRLINYNICEYSRHLFKTWYFYFSKSTIHVTRDDVCTRAFVTHFALSRNDF